jgi:hypothetical protein
MKGHFARHRNSLNERNSAENAGHDRGRSVTEAGWISSKDRRSIRKAGGVFRDKPRIRIDTRGVSRSFNWPSVRKSGPESVGDDDYSTSVSEMQQPR